ncbi:response regulator transcription factor [Anaeromicropila herbilytica]|uniref:Stage 0 sporulation protein A homolog n=1 Tax=Anaeromicropila herbilytica TaxID=2785025 RepID=A0A7R7EQ93_9FIRM|nr:helix-turn-helix domain-containing protein [Anaeromicropila herbilytica]BCN32791.1 DNA-binding response regulator [Anaeromicropila herbilytica]
MYKILVADEERAFINEITDTINKKIDRAKVVDYAITGRDAIDKAKLIKPEIILLDVKISGINGLEAIKSIRRFLPEVHIIIVSSYDYFGFLREAIRLSVDDYILKPVNKTNLVDVLNGIIDEIQIDDTQVHSEDLGQIVMNDVIEATEHNIVYSVLFNKNFESQLLKYQNMIKIGQNACVISTEIISQTNKYSDDYQQMRSCIKSIMKDNKTEGVVGPLIGNRIVSIISFDEVLDSSYIKSIMYQIANCIHVNLNKEIGADTKIGIGNLVLLEELYTSYEESLRSIALNEGEDVLHIDDISNRKRMDCKEYVEMQLKLVESIKLAKEEAMIIYCSLLQALELLTEKHRKSKIVELLVLSCYASKTYCKNENEYFDYSDMVENINKLEKNDLDIWAIYQFELIIKATRNNNNEKVSNVVSMALKYIEEHYKEELSLEDVSKHVSVSPQYLSKLFKEETNSNFVEYTTKLRIEKAKDLMNSTDKTIKEICFSVGYHDPNYFSRKFKSIVGISPTDYLKGKEIVMY